MREPGFQPSAGARGVLTFVFGLFVLGIGTVYLQASFFLYGDGSTTLGGLVGPIGLVVTLVGVVISVAMMVRGT